MICYNIMSFMFTYYNLHCSEVKFDIIYNHCNFYAYCGIVKTLLALEWLHVFKHVLSSLKTIKISPEPTVGSGL